MEKSAFSWRDKESAKLISEWGGIYGELFPQAAVSFLLKEATWGAKHRFTWWIMAALLKNVSNRFPFFFLHYSLRN